MANGQRRSSVASEAVIRLLREMWLNKTGEYLEPLDWDRRFRHWIKVFRSPIVFDALQNVVAQAPRKREPPDAEDIPRYARVLWADEKEPGSGHCYLVRGKLRKYYCGEDDPLVLALLLKAMRAGVTPDIMDAAVRESDDLDDFFCRIGIDPRAYHAERQNAA